MYDVEGLGFCRTVMRTLGQKSAGTNLCADVNWWPHFSHSNLF